MSHCRSRGRVGLGLLENFSESLPQKRVISVPSFSSVSIWLYLPIFGPILTIYPSSSPEASEHLGFVSRHRIGNTSRTTHSKVGLNMAHVQLSNTQTYASTKFVFSFSGHAFRIFQGHHIFGPSQLGRPTRPKIWRRTCGNRWSRKLFVGRTSELCQSQRLVEQCSRMFKVFWL